MIALVGGLSEEAQRRLHVVAEALRKLAEAILESARACAADYLYIVSPSDYGDVDIDIDSIVTTWQSLTDALRNFKPRDPIPKTPYKPSYKTVIFDKRLKFPKCRSNCR